MKPVIANHPGYIGAFSRDEAEGAIPNGAVVRKRNSEKGDTRPNGDRGRVLGSIDMQALGMMDAERAGHRFMYFVEWDATPGCAVAVVDVKVGAEQ
jgi:hypothetical protein